MHAQEILLQRPTPPVWPTQPPIKSGQGVALTISFHLLLKLRMSGVLPLLPLFAFTVWTGTTYPLYLPCFKDSSVRPERQTIRQNESIGWTAMSSLH